MYTVYSVYITVLVYICTLQQDWRNPRILDSWILVRCGICRQFVTCADIFVMWPKLFPNIASIGNSHIRNSGVSASLLCRKKSSATEGHLSKSCESLLLSSNLFCQLLCCCWRELPCRPPNRNPPPPGFIPLPPRWVIPPPLLMWPITPPPPMLRFIPPAALSPPPPVWRQLSVLRQPSAAECRGISWVCRQRSWPAAGRHCWSGGRYPSSSELPATDRGYNIKKLNKKKIGTSKIYRKNWKYNTSISLAINKCSTL